MKKVFTVALMLGTFAVFANTTPKHNDTKKSTANETKKEIVINKENKEDDALRCSIKDGSGNKMSCWFCDCDDLARAFKEAF